MRKLIFSILTVCTLFLVGCLETTQEITLNEDGSGTLVNTNDLSALIGIAKSMGAAGELEKAGDANIDSTVALKDGVDSIPNLTPEEKKLAASGTLRIKMNMKDEKFLTHLSFPFKSPSQIAALNKLSSKMMQEVMKDKMEGGPAGGGGDEMPPASSFDDYYNLEFSKGELTRKVNKDKYAGVENDEYFKGMKEASAMGLTMKANYIINLPRPAEKAEGKNVKLSADKKKVTISADLDEFLSDPSSLEFKIKY